LALVAHFIIDVAKSDLPYLLLQGVPKAAVDGYPGLIDRLPWG
jgi:hypothetical protein